MDGRFELINFIIMLDSKLSLWSLYSWLISYCRYYAKVVEYNFLSPSIRTISVRGC